MQSYLMSPDTLPPTCSPHPAHPPRAAVIPLPTLLCSTLCSTAQHCLLSSLFVRQLHEGEVSMGI